MFLRLTNFKTTPNIVSVDREMVGARNSLEAKGVLKHPTLTPMSCPMNQNPNGDKRSGIQHQAH